jgi:hypothetical protein
VKDRVPICLGAICITGDTNYFSFDGKKWAFHAERYRELMTRCSDAGVRIVRVMLWSPFGKKTAKEAFTPYSLAGTAFDLNLWNDWYWPIMREMRDIDKSVNVTGRYDIADNCDFAIGDWGKAVPWKNNIQGIKTLYQKEAWPHYERLARKAVKELGADQYYSTGNEMNYPPAVALFENVVVKLIKDRTFIPEQFVYGPQMEDANYVNPPVMETDKDGRTYLTHYPSPVAEGVLGTFKARAGDLLGETIKRLIYRDVHSVGSPPTDSVRKFGPREHQMIACWGKYPIRAWASTDGKKLATSDPRASKCDKDFDGARISHTVWHDMAHDLIKAYPDRKGGMQRCLVLEHCPQTSDPECLSLTFQSISKAVKECTGTNPENLGKFPYHPPEPPDPPDPPEPPEPPEPPAPTKTCYQKFIANRPLSKWQIGKFLSCLLGGKK